MLRFTAAAQILKSFSSHPTHVTTSDMTQAKRHWCGSWLIAASQGSMPAQEMDVDTSCHVRLQQVLIWTIIPIDRILQGRFVDICLHLAQIYGKCRFPTFGSNLW